MVWFLTFGCIVAYIVGIFLLVKITPSLVKRAFDDALFIGVAAVAILGAMLDFGAIGVTYAIFNGANGGTGVRLFDALLLVILGIVTLRTAFTSLRPRYDSSFGTNRTSRLMAGSFYLLLTAAAAVVLVLIFVS